MLDVSNRLSEVSECSTRTRIPGGQSVTFSRAVGHTIRADRFRVVDVVRVETREGAPSRQCIPPLFEGGRNAAFTCLHRMLCRIFI